MKEDLEKILNFATAVSFLTDHVECVIEDYRDGEEITEKQLKSIEKRIETVKKFEKGIKEILEIKE